MRILDRNQKYMLTSDSKGTYLVQSSSLQVSKELSEPFALGSLQYGTGIAALCQGSFITFYDFHYQRVSHKLDTFRKLVQVCMLKNLVICVSEQRIIIYDLIQENNLCHIALYDGSRTTIHRNYYNLKLFYPVGEHVYEERHIWTNKTSKIVGSQQETMETYDAEGEILCFVEGNLLSLCQDGEVVRGCSFQMPILEVIVGRSPSTFFLRIGREEDMRFVKVNLSEKHYLKKGKGKEIQNASEKSCMICMGDDLMIWEDQILYQTEIDDNYYPSPVKKERKSKIYKEEPIQLRKQSSQVRIDSQEKQE